MSVLLADTNVILDVLLDRRPHVEASRIVWVAVETGACKGLLAAHAITTIHYLTRKNLGLAKSKQIVAAILRVFDIAPVDRTVLRDALELSLPDFEDAVTSAAARRARCDFIVSRDPKGFRGSPVRCLTPEAAAPLLGV